MRVRESARCAHRPTTRSLEITLRIAARMHPKRVTPSLTNMLAHSHARMATRAHSLPRNAHVHTIGRRALSLAPPRSLTHAAALSLAPPLSQLAAARRANGTTRRATPSAPSEAPVDAAAAALGGGGGDGAAWTARRAVAVASIAVGTDDGGGGGGGVDGGIGGEAALRAVAYLAANGASGAGGDADGAGGPVALASRFARRISELETALESSRAAQRILEAARADDDVRKRALRVRLAKCEKAAAGGADIEYLRNVLLRWFTMPPSARGALFPVIAAACAFTPKEVGQINRAREAHAPSAVGSWLWGGGGGGDGGGGSADGAFFGDGAPPTTPLAMPPPPLRTPCAGASQPISASARMVPPATTGGAAGGDAAMLRDKVAKLRWLLQCANAEITRLRADAAGGGGGGGGSGGG